MIRVTTRGSAPRFPAFETVRVRENEQSSTPVQYVTTPPGTQYAPSVDPAQSRIHPTEQAAIDKVIEDLSSQLDRIREYAIEDEDEMKNLRIENTSLKQELEVKDQVIQLLMSRLKDSAGLSLQPESQSAVVSTHD